MFPEYLNISQEQLGAGSGVKVEVAGNFEAVAAHLAGAMKDEIVQALARSWRATLIVPVGPVDQYALLARMINEQRISCANVVFIGMDEYLDENDRWVDLDHPLSFRGFLNRKFYDLLDASLAPPETGRVFPDPNDPGAIGRLIEERGGVDACFGGIGITGHIAFNEPPEADADVSAAEFAARRTRVLDLTRETRTINSVTVGGEISIIPRRAVTVGMSEILGAGRIRLYCNRPWQSAVVRRALHGEISARCPASLVRQHPDAKFVLADFVADQPDIRLR